MADVYLARDVSLDRQVAVKVLFPEFANDPNFVERFRREAKAAANLNHPNIVGIFDWGQEQGTYYIVMEYVVGRSMADVLRSTGPLSPDRAAEIACDVAEALGNAHSAGLVHRDVKLGNIIVSDDGVVKVADFGIATALARRTSDNLTQIGSVMGTATYFSPEQAQGKSLDGRSDLYSLGVVLYEMIVGKPPFSADTSTAVAVKHVQERPVSPSARGVTVAPSLEAIILKLLAKNPVNRYPKAEDLCSDLRRYLAGAHTVPAKAPRTTESKTGDVTAARTGGTGVHPTASVRPEVTGSAPSSTRPPGRPTGGHPAQRPLRAGGPPSQPPGGAPPSQYPPPTYFYEEVHRSDGWKRTALMLLGLTALIAVLVFLAVSFYRTLGLDDAGEPETPTDPGESLLVEVPDVVGLAAPVAEARLIDERLVAEVTYEVNTEVAENTVFRQNPPAGQRVEDGDTVLLTVSQSENPLVPPVRGRNSIDARRLLTEAGYTVIALEGPSQAEVGIVVAQDPPSGTEFALGEAVTITISTGPGQIFVPDVRDQTLVQAVQTLTDLGFRVGESREPSNIVPEGYIIDTDPTVGSPVGLDSAVFLIVSTGPPLVAVPDVEGLLFDTGKLALEREGLLIGIVTFQPVEPGSTDVGRILAQSPPANVEVDSETAVDLVVGESAEESPEQPDQPGPTDTLPTENGDQNPETSEQEQEQAGAAGSEPDAQSAP